MNATVQAASLARARRLNEPRDILHAVGTELRNIFGNDVQDLADNLQVSVEISANGRIKNGAQIGERRLEQLARGLVDANDEDYTITTKDGQTINQNEVFVRTKMQIGEHGKSLNRDSAWQALRDFHASLVGSGITED